ncbi:actin bundling/missing in metastasis-related [Schistosoma mansoni]|uniref:actin bundling/missing in metastasis-related n=1 Tax=Schistosoma mansoni TaxID=6183 RepID=UPI0001A62CF6|nr:actin bundling/missing in metastasis-related [Schistosoma mansoni]|eukprot:XP_018655371.1 actin bundling/missing in metastasis-related [Schistosoma mansoni]
MDISQAHGGDVVNIANYLLNDLKNSYQIWEELISKCTKFHSALKVATQASSAFLDTFQKVADLATKTLGGSKEIGACLTRYCMRQKSLESKVKSMGNHLVTSLANPLNSKVDEWKRNLCQLEKDRTRQTKRVRAELKKALSEAQKWEKKAAKVGVTGGSGVGPGVGHGIIPHAKHMCSNSESNAIGLQTAKAAREVGIKKELVENTEKSAMRLLLLEERSRFCFFVSCLLPILECQSSMLHEIATMDELIKTLTKETEFPDQLVEDVESIVLRMGRRDFSASRGSSKIMSVFVPDGGDRINNINEVLGGLLMTNGNRNYVNSSDTESGRHGADMLSPYQICRDLEMVGRCNSVCDSADISLCGASSHSGSGGSNCPSLLSPARSNVAHLGSRESSLISVDSAASGSGNANSTNSIGMSNTNIPHSDPGETQFKTLCRPGHYRTASNGDNDFSKNYLKNGFHHDKIDSYMVAKSMIAFSEQSQLTDSNNNDDNITTNGSDSGNAPAHLSNNPTSPSLSNSANQHFLLENYPPITATTTGTTGDPPIPNSGRHTISSAYERGGHAPARASITALSFNPPVGKASSKDSGVDSSTVLYPKQAVPPPVYTNLIQLAHAAQRKFSMSQLPIVHSYENIDSTLDRFRYAKIDMTNHQQFIHHQSSSRNSISTNPQQYHYTTNASPNTTNISNTNNCNWSVSDSINKLDLNDSAVSQSYHDEETKYANPSTVLKSQVDKLANSTSLSNSCHNSKNCLDSVSISDATSTNNPTSVVVGNNDIHSYQRSGTDPFSMEMDELDQVMPGSSRGSSLTMASSTTNDSLPSSNGSPALTSYNSNQNSTQRSFSSNSNPMSSNEQQISENKLHYATPVIKNQSQCSTTPGQVFNPLRQSTLGSNQVCMNTVCETTDYDENLATDLVSVETANLMSELSSQLQQLAARSNDVNFSQSTYKSRDIFHKEPIKHDDFDLPPPPPPSMFTEQYCSDVVKSECSPIQTTNINCNSTTSIIVNDNNNNNTDEVSDDDSNKNLSPFLLALKQSVKQRADRLAAGNSTNNRT